MSAMNQFAIETPAPEFEVAAWLNVRQPLSLAALRGKVVLVYAFQMLCPACVTHGLPQAKKVAASFSRNEVEVIGLHTVFEHHAAMGQVALEAFLHEYQIGFPVAIDSASGTGPVPKTMAAYGMRGTPTLLLFDRAGRLRQHHFGMLEDLQLGAQIAALLQPTPAGSDCLDGRCRIAPHA
ncbi:redoxin domain-containing protein [Duganella fentianensis]|uniref:redoxin domain-containing protein n=1 Tax=Duganella fentianensis TaxID=2692177 RepID=UPI0032B27F37